MTWIADRKYFSIRYFVRTDKNVDKNAAMRETATPMLHRKSRANISPFKRISRCVSLFSLSSVAAPARIPVPIRGTIRDTHPGGKCLRPCWNPCDVGKCRVFDIKECVRLAIRRRCRLSANHPYATPPPHPRHSSAREIWRSIQAFFAKDNNLHTRSLYIYERREDGSKTRFQNNARTRHAAPPGGEGGDIFLSGDRGAPSIRCKRGVKTPAREREGGRRERETELRPRYPR